MANRIEDYAMIGDCKTAALVGADGSIDWLCLPRFDSSSCFSALVGSEEHGTWRISPACEVERVERRYLDGSLVLSTRFHTKSGLVELLDFMPVGCQDSHVVRIVRGVEGTVEMALRLIVRFGYGITIPWAEKVDEDTTAFIAGPDMLTLRSPIPLDAHDLQTDGGFRVRAGERVAFSLSYATSFSKPPQQLDIEAALASTRDFWTEWSDRFLDAGKWRSTAKRSLITLKGLSYAPTGAIVAAVTTSLPEQLGGERNWDYRYCWIRDAAFTLLAFLNAGYGEEAHAFRDWLLRAVAGSPEQIQIMYGIGGERRLAEEILPWLPGHLGSAPVRIGNAAASQCQVDIFGELFDALTLAMKAGLSPVARSPDLRRVILRHLEEIWSDPDSGIWEVRGPPQHFTLSKVMAWVAFDRASRNDHLTEDADERELYKNVAAAIHDDICRNAVCERRRCFTQAYGSSRMDAGLLLLAPVGFLPATHELVVNTVAEIEQRLINDKLVMRYETESGIDGLPPGEGAFLACSFWLVDNYILQGRLREAEDLFEHLIGLCNDVGLLAEEYDPVARRQLGNFPQAFSHVALVNSAFALSRATSVGQEVPSVPAQAA